MSTLLEDMGYSSEEWENVPDKQKAEIEKHYARIKGHQLLEREQMLIDDDIQIKKRNKVVLNDLFGKGETNMPEEDDTRITILADNVGDEAIKTMLRQGDKDKDKNKKPDEGKTTVPPPKTIGNGSKEPPIKKEPSTSTQPQLPQEKKLSDFQKALIATALGIGLIGGGYGLYMFGRGETKDTDTRNVYEIVGD